MEIKERTKNNIAVHIGLILSSLLLGLILWAGYGDFITPEEVKEKNASEYKEKKLKEANTKANSNEYKNEELTSRTDKSPNSPTIKLAAEESYSDASCKKASGQSQSLMKTVAEGVGVPESSLKYEGAFIGGPSGGCAGLFSTPKGPYECALVAWTTDGGKTFFIGPSSAGLIVGMQNICREAK